MLQDIPPESQPFPNSPKRLVIARFQGTNHSIYAYCDPSRPLPLSPVLIQPQTPNAPKAAPEEPVRYYLRKAISVEGKRKQEIEMILNIRQQKQLELHRINPLLYDNPTLTVFSSQQTPTLHLETPTAPRCCSLAQLLTENAINRKQMAIQTKLALVVEIFSKARTLLFYHSLLVTLDNLILDPQHHFYPNLMSTTGLRLLLWGEPISSKEFMQVIPLLPSNTFQLHPKDRINNHMLRQKTIANTVLSIIVGYGVTYTGEVDQEVGVEEVERVLKGMKGFYRTLLGLAPFRKKLGDFVKKASLVKDGEKSSRGKLQTFIWETMVEERLYTYAQMWECLKLSPSLEEGSKKVRELERKLSKLTEFIWSNWQQSKKHQYIDGYVVPRREPLMYYQTLLTTALWADLRPVHRHGSLSAFIHSAPLCHAKQHMISQLMAEVNLIREAQLRKSDRWGEGVLGRGEVGVVGGDNLQSQPHEVGILSVQEAVREVLGMMGAFLNHRVPEEKLLMEEERQKGVREFVKGLRL